jgi:hypothetical protein
VTPPGAKPLQAVQHARGSLLRETSRAKRRSGKETQCVKAVSKALALDRHGKERRETDSGSEKARSGTEEGDGFTGGQSMKRCVVSEKRMTGYSAARGVVALLVLGSCVGVGLGCGEGQAAPDYEGEPLVRVRGQVEAELSVGGDIEVGVLWLTAAADLDIVCTAEVRTENEPSACVDGCGEISCDDLEAWEACIGACPDVTFEVVDVQTSSVPFITGGVGQTTPAVGQFPAQFSLDVLEPPPPEALIGSSTGERLAIGLFVALDPAGAPWHLDLTQSGYPDWLLGGSENHFLVYAPEGIPVGSLWSTLTDDIALPPGYTLMELTVEQTDEGYNELLRPAPGGDASSVHLKIAPADSIAWPAI